MMLPLDLETVLSEEIAVTYEYKAVQFKRDVVKCGKQSNGSLSFSDYLIHWINREIFSI